MGESYCGGAVTGQVASQQAAFLHTLYFKLLPRVPALTSDTNGLQPGSQLNPSLLQLLLAMASAIATEIKLGRKGMDNFQGVD